MKRICLGLLIFAVVLLTVCACQHCEQAQSGTLVTLHYADWCPHCKIMKPVWAQVKAEIKSSRPDLHFVEVDEAKNPTPGINTIPTIILLDQHGHSYKYSGEPDASKLKTWILAPKH